MQQHEIDKMKDKQPIFDIQPVVPCDQPGENDDEPQEEDPGDEYAPKIFMLNDFCFLQVLDHLSPSSVINLYGTCKKFQEFIRQYNYFRRFRKFSLNICRRSVCSDLHRILLHIGPYISDLAVNRFIDEKSDLTPYLHLITRYIGSNLRRATFFRCNLHEGDYFSIIAPILRNLESLGIKEYYVPVRSGINDIQPIDFIDMWQLCPNLEELTLQGTRLIQPFLKCRNPWVKLRHLSVPFNETLIETTLESFIRRHPQLVSLQSDTSVSVVQHIAEHLPMLEKLFMSTFSGSSAQMIKMNTPENSDLFINYLGRLQHLTDVKLGGMNIEFVGFDRVIDCLATMPRLRRISLGQLDNQIEYQPACDDPLINMASQLNHLEAFAIRGIYIVEATIVEFIRISRLKSLKTFMYRPINGIEITDQLIPNVVDVLQSCRAPATGPFELFLEPKEYSEKWPAFKDADGHLHVNPFTWPYTCEIYSEFLTAGIPFVCGSITFSQLWSVPVKFQAFCIRCFLYETQILIATNHVCKN